MNTQQERKCLISMCHMLKPKSHMVKLVDQFAIKYLICTILLANCFHKLSNCDPQNMYNVAVCLSRLFQYSSLKKEAVGPRKHWTVFVFSTCYNTQKFVTYMDWCEGLKQHHLLSLKIKYPLQLIQNLYHIMFNSSSFSSFPHPFSYLFITDCCIPLQYCTI